MIVKFYLWKYRFCNSAGNACVPTNAKDPQPRKAVGDLLAEDEGFDLIKERLRQAVAGSAHSRRIYIGSNPLPQQIKQQIPGWVSAVFGRG